MKKILLASLCLALTMGFNACKKNSDVTALNPQSTTGLSTVKLSGIKSGEPVAFILNNNSSSTSSVLWKVIPTVGVYKSINGKKATFKFTIAGKYVISASDGLVNDSTVILIDSLPYTGTDTIHYAPKDSSFYPPYTPPVDSSNYHNGNVDTTIAFFKNDQINITPSLIDTGGISYGILFQASTIKTYPSSAATLVSTSIYDSSISNSIGINYQGVLLPYGTTFAGITTTATSANYLSMWQDAKYNFRIVYNNITYTGSINKVNNTYTITWPYTSGVVISPLVLKK